MHSRFWLSREHGEWFRPTTDLTDYIAHLKEEVSSEGTCGCGGNG